MGSQMFSPQENEPRGPEEGQETTDPGEQFQTHDAPPQWDTAEDASYEQGYRGYDVHTEGEKLRPAPSISSKQWIWIIIAVVVLLVIGGSVLNEILGSIFFLVGLVVVGYVIWRLAFNRAVQLPMQHFEVSGQQNVIVDNPFGAIRIHRGSANAVEVRGARYYSSLFPSRPSYPLNATQQGNQVRVEVWNRQARGSFSLGDFGRIDLDITVPESSGVHVQSDASSITIDGIQGHAFIRTNAGTIGMALPAGTAFILDAKTNLGTVSNLFGNTYAGEGPRAMLHLRTHLGTISVKPMW